MYDKEGSLLRVETTIVRSKDFRVYRAKEGEPKGPKSWRILRKGVSDMYRRAEVCRAANQRYLEALASVTGSSSLLQEAAEVCAPIVRDGKPYRGLNALAQKDHALLRALSRGEFALSGIRNADLRASLYPPNQSQNNQGRNPPPQCRAHSPICSAASSWVTQKTASHPSLPNHCKRPTNHHRFIGRLLR